MVKTIRTNENAVSPVVGVMLMLVVTIIIAAVVSGFGMGMLSDTKSAPAVQIGYAGVMAGDMGESGKIGLVFENLGGDTIRLDEISLNLRESGISNVTDSSGVVIGTSKGHEAAVSYRDLPSESIIDDGPTATTAVLEHSEKKEYKNYRFAKLPARSAGVGEIGETSVIVRSASNLIIEPGQKFIVLADKYSVEDGDKFGSVYYVAERGNAANPYSSGWFEVSSKTTYSIVDDASGSIISTGNLVGSVI
ncbi:type IV pilin N-terminal domain-containing protein [Methanolacinia paynteri]|uniref:type IV pilin N-terminal domain-containing protein n=1 Tax=Methanolacinia paynteri TaxID=230356 RepID=UPI000694FCD8|nr:type IV pilin N-terminal domain-containing protein [Methanolacinia paynteri]